MANEVSGINMLVEVGGTGVVAQSGATVSTTSELAEAITKDSNFTTQDSGDQEWTLSYEGQMTDDTGKQALANGNVDLQVEVDATDDSTDNPQYEPISGLQSVTLNLEQELNSVPPGIDQPVGWKGYVPLRRSFSIDAEGHYLDPASDLVYDAVLDAKNNGKRLPAKLNVFGGTFEGSIATDSMELDAPADDNASFSFSWGGSGDLTQSGTVETTIDSILSLYFNQTTATVNLRQKDSDGNDVSASTYWEGDAHLSNFEISMERSAYPEISTELQGDGALSRNQVT
jgi:predicted secreted protein